MSTGDQINKTCDDGGYCAYKYPGGSFWGCGYCGYCDFQRPRDSRDQSNVFRIKEKGETKNGG